MKINLYKAGLDILISRKSSLGNFYEFLIWIDKLNQWGLLGLEDSGGKSSMKHYHGSDLHKYDGVIPGQLPEATPEYYQYLINPNMKEDMYE